MTLIYANINKTCRNLFLRHIFRNPWSYAGNEGFIFLCSTFERKRVFITLIPRKKARQIDGGHIAGLKTTALR
jgi:hypothetical protein